MRLIITYPFSTKVETVGYLENVNNLPMPSLVLFLVVTIVGVDLFGVAVFGFDVFGIAVVGVDLFCVAIVGVAVVGVITNDSIFQL